MRTRLHSFLVLLGLALAPAAAHAQIGAVQNIAPGVYFHEGDPRLGTCNNGWIVMNDYVVMVDANYPIGAKVLVPKVRATTDKPVRFVIDTHWHPDHSFGNEVWAALGAIPVAQANAYEELAATGASRWEESAKSRPDVAASRLRLPGMTYSDSLAFDDGGHRVELRWPGRAHTLGDTLVWLPRERILFTGDVSVNGSYNYIHDSFISDWINVLESAKKLGALKVCPGHGPIGGPEVIADQEAYFAALVRGVRSLVAAGKSAAEAEAAAPGLAAELRKDRRIVRYVPADVYFTAHVQRVYAELAGAGAR
jgi:glyoxylase-like metal-dependent hydrolase (beta-lactamase superfamily II)